MMNVKIPIELSKVTIRNVDYPVYNRVVQNLPDDYLDDLKKMFPTAEPVTGITNPPPTPFTDPHNKVG